MALSTRTSNPVLGVERKRTDIEDRVTKSHQLPLGPIVRALREGSPLLRRLASAPVPDGVRWLAFTATLDMIVPGPRSVPAYAHVETVKVGGVGHLGMLLSHQVAASIVAALPVHGEATAARLAG
jgi:triacylglycerol lipase